MITYAYNEIIKFNRLLISARVYLLESLRIMPGVFGQYESIECSFSALFSNFFQL